MRVHASGTDLDEPFDTLTGRCMNHILLEQHVGLKHLGVVRDVKTNPGHFGRKVKDDFLTLTHAFAICEISEVDGMEADIVKNRFEVFELAA